jgi:prophage antirepressor-like protein
MERVVFMSSEIMIFENPEFGQVRTFEIDGEPWFVGRDVAVALGYEKPENAMRTHVDKDDTLKQGVMDTIGRMQNTTIINESGFYSLVLSSKLDSAKKFKRWVTSEVIPSIRKTGSYGVVDNSVDKSEIAQFIIDCPNEKLPYILKLFGIEEIQTEPERPYLKYAERIERFGEVKALMDMKGIKPTSLAKVMNIPKSSMSNYMSGYSVPSVERCNQMIETLHGLI